MARQTVMMALWMMGMTRLALADPGADLAPGPRELAEVQAELEERLATAEAIERAVARIQSAYASTQPTAETCADPIRGPLVLRLRLFATAWHDAAQRVSVQARRVDRVAKAPTVTPIIDADRRELLDRLLARSNEQENGWLELVAWVDKQLGVRCDELTLSTMPGLPDPIIRAQGETQGPAAVVAITPGYLCTQGATDGIELDRRVFIVDGPVCWSDQSKCSCTPAPVNPAAVLGPAPPTPPEL